MGSAIGQSLPIAVGVLVSPMPVVAVVLMLVSRRARANSLAFLIGWIVGIAVLGSLVLLLLGGRDLAHGEPPAWASILKIVLGLLLLLLAVKQWRGRTPAGDQAAAPRWMSAIDTFTAVKAFVLGFALGAINPKNLLLVVSGAATIAQATPSTAEQFGALAVFTLIASVGVAVPIVVYLSMGEAAAHILDELKAWMTANNAVIMAVLLLILGAKMLGDGIATLN
jgi:threonine/homoserine/homoserine lactone efflux protein